jgi:hypothetical protein
MTAGVRETETRADRRARLRLRDVAGEWFPTVAPDVLDRIVAASWVEGREAHGSGERTATAAVAAVRRHGLRALRGEPLDLPADAEQRIAALSADDAAASREPRADRFRRRARPEALGRRAQPRPEAVPSPEAPSASAHAGEAAAQDQDPPPPPTRRRRGRHGEDRLPARPDEPERDAGRGPLRILADTVQIITGRQGDDAVEVVPAPAAEEPAEAPPRTSPSHEAPPAAPVEPAASAASDPVDKQPAGPPRVAATAEPAATPAAPEEAAPVVEPTPAPVPAPEPATPVDREPVPPPPTRPVRARTARAGTTAKRVPAAGPANAAVARRRTGPEQERDRRTVRVFALAPLVAALAVFAVVLGSSLGGAEDTTKLAEIHPAGGVSYVVQAARTTSAKTEAAQRAAAVRRAAAKRRAAARHRALVAAHRRAATLHRRALARRRAARRAAARSRPLPPARSVPAPAPTPQPLVSAPRTPVRSAPAPAPSPPKRSGGGSSSGGNTWGGEFGP